MSVLHKKSARLRDEERARLIWLLSTDKAVTSALLGKLTLAERYDEGTLADHADVRGAAGQRQRVLSLACIDTQR